MTVAVPLTVRPPVPLRGALNVTTLGLLALIVMRPFELFEPLNVTEPVFETVMAVAFEPESLIVSLMTSAPVPAMVSVWLAAVARVKVDGLAADPRVSVAPAAILAVIVRPVAVMEIGPVSVRLLVSPAVLLAVNPKFMVIGLATTRLPLS